MPDHRDVERQIRAHLEPSQAAVARILRATLSTDPSTREPLLKQWILGASLSTALVMVVMMWPTGSDVEASQFAIRGTAACVTTTRLEPSSQGVSIVCHNRESEPSASFLAANGTMTWINLSSSTTHFDPRPESSSALQQEKQE